MSKGCCIRRMIRLLQNWKNAHQLELLVLAIILMIVIYESVTVLIILVFRLVPVTFTKLLYKISHSLILNIIYGEILYYILNNLPKKYKKISIN